MRGGAIVCGWLLSAWVGVAYAPLARAAGPAEPLLKLVPADATLTLALEDLKGHFRAWQASALARDLRALPAFKAWLASDRPRGFSEAIEGVAAALGTDVATLRDEVFGEAAVLVLRVPPGSDASAARGLLLLKMSDRALLDRLTDSLDDSQRQAGELERVERRERRGLAYHVRKFRGGRKSDEFYAKFGAGYFAWSNSETLLLTSLDQHAQGTAGLTGDEGFRLVRDRLPSPAFASLFVDPRALSRLLAQGPPPAKAEEARVLGVIGRYLGALRSCGAALAWRDGPELRTEEVVDPTRLDASLKRWGERPPAALTPGLGMVPSDALAVTALSLDPEVVLQGFEALLPDEARAKFENLCVALDGLLLGLSTREQVIPRLGPGVIAYLERPVEASGAAWRWPAVVSVELEAGPEGSRVGEALKNALKTFLALYTLDDARAALGLKVVTRALDGALVTSLSPSGPFAFGSKEGRLVVSRFPEAVARALATKPRAGGRLEGLRARYFPGATSFACVDAAGLYEIASRHRPALARRLASKQGRPEVETARDLDQALAIIRLVDAVYAVSTVERGFARVHRVIGLVVQRPR